MVVWARQRRVLTLYSPFCHENAAGCTNLHRSANDIATMNIRIYEVVSGYIAGSANSDTEFHIKYAPYTFFLTETARQTGITIHLSLYANKIRSARALHRKTVCSFRTAQPIEIIRFTSGGFYIILYLLDLSDRKGRNLIWNATIRAIRRTWKF